MAKRGKACPGWSSEKQQEKLHTSSRRLLPIGTLRILRGTSGTSSVYPGDWPRHPQAAAVEQPGTDLRACPGAAPGGCDACARACAGPGLDRPNGVRICGLPRLCCQRPSKPVRLWGHRTSASSQLRGWCSLSSQVSSSRSPDEILSNVVDRPVYASSSSSAFASFRSGVSKPSVNHWYTGASSSRASSL